MNINQLLYFSLNPQTTLYACKYAEKYRFEDSFIIVNKKDSSGNWIGFNHVSELFSILDELSKLDGQSTLSRLYVIIDYYSLCDINIPHCKPWESAKQIRRAIIAYPEVLFLFDEGVSSTEDDSNDPLDFETFLLKKSYTDNQEKKDGDNFNIYKKYHQFFPNSKHPFEFIVRDRSNLFDGSNLRYAVKKYMYSNMNVAKENFERIQSSRSNHLALSVEEERSQNRFNCYALYANGYRVIPISSAAELKDANTAFGREDSTFSPDIIFRDYDLQFKDKIAGHYKRHIQPKPYPSLPLLLDFNIIDDIRGAKYIEKYQENPDSETYITINKWFTTEIDIEKHRNEYWGHLCSIPSFFVSKGVEHMKIQSFTDNEWEKIRSKKGESKQTAYIDGCNELLIRGIQKPATGIYCPFKDVLGERYKKDVEWRDSKKDRKNDNYYINIKRRWHDHGVPLDVYDLAKEMLNRAKKYYGESNYILSSMLAQEVIEFLNGFHESLMLKAYHLHAVSENAITMKLIGGNEELLKLDAQFRIAKVIQDVNRMMARKDKNTGRNVFKLNILNQIFNDCRSFCKNREHFLSEAAYIGAMSRVNNNIHGSFQKLAEGVKVLIKKNNLYR